MEIRISYNGKPWRYYTVSAEFPAKLQAFLQKHPHCDVIWEVSPYAR